MTVSGRCCAAAGAGGNAASRCYRATAPTNDGGAILQAA